MPPGERPRAPRHGEVEHRADVDGGVRGEPEGFRRALSAHCEDVVSGHGRQSSRVGSPPRVRAGSGASSGRESVRRLRGVDVRAERRRHRDLDEVERCGEARSVRAPSHLVERVHRGAEGPRPVAREEGLPRPSSSTAIHPSAPGSSPRGVPPPLLRPDEVARQHERGSGRSPGSPGGPPRVRSPDRRRAAPRARGRRRRERGQRRGGPRPPVARPPPPRRRHARGACPSRGAERGLVDAAEPGGAAAGEEDGVEGLRLGHIGTVLAGCGTRLEARLGPGGTGRPAPWSRCCRPADRTAAEVSCSARG